MSEKTKKWLVLAGLMVICVVLVIGIRMRLYKEDISDYRFETNTEEQNENDDREQNIAKNTTEAPEPSGGTKPTGVPQPTKGARPSEGVKPTEGVEPTEEAKPTKEINPTEVAKPTDEVQPTEEAKPTEASVVDIGSINPDDVQELQPKPEKEQDPMPTGTPALAEGTDLTDPDIKPVYQEDTTVEEAKKPVDEEEPKMGDMKDGYMYVLGFGWVPYEGEGEGTYAEDMYENGNKIGIMD